MEPRSRRAVPWERDCSDIALNGCKPVRVRIRVTDPLVLWSRQHWHTLLGPDDKPIRTARANEVGEIVFTDLPLPEMRGLQSSSRASEHGD